MDAVNHELIRLGEALKAARAEAHLNQETLADLAGLSRRPVYLAENAEGAVRLDSLIRMLDALGLRLTIERKADR